MKAIRISQFGGPEVLKLEETPLPRAGTGQVVVKIKAIGVNPVETYQRSGANPDLALPWTPGRDAAGIIEGIGETVSRDLLGSRIYTSDTLSGAYAEFVLCDAGSVHPLPSKISFEQGAAMGIPYATAYRALFHRAEAKAGETVFIHGASGGVGLAAVQLGRAAGLTVIGSAGTEAGRRLALENGAHHVLDHGASGYLENLMQLTAGRGVGIILEMLANLNLGKDLPLLAKHGRVIVIGSRGKVEITPRDLMSREADIRAMNLFNATSPELSQIHAALGAGLEDGTLRPVIGREMPLGDAAQAHVAVLAPGARGKIVLKP